MQERELELCVETLQGCDAAREGGADRIELCAALKEGGVTPGRGLVRAAVQASGLPVHALIRPRTGDSVYSEAEFGVVCADMEDALEAGAAGVVVGVLTADRRVHRGRVAELVRRAGGRPVTFHRAFDRTADLFESLDALLDLGCARILTSGGQPTVSLGFEMLSVLAQRGGGRIRIAAGGGVTLGNAARLVQVPGLDLHASLRGKSAPTEALDVLWDEDAGRVSAADVRQLRSIVHAGTEGVPSATQVCVA